VPVHEVRDLLGHSSIAVTDVYSHATAARLAQAVERL
jgi:site-specific recombinase XerD